MKQRGATYSKNFCWAVLFWAMVLSTDTAAEAQEKDEKKNYNTFTLYWENDAFGGTDKDYSNGLKLTWSSSYGINDQKPVTYGWKQYVLNKLPFVNDPETQRAISLSLGQDIYTPEDYLRTELIVDDRPYAGYLYLSAGFHNIVFNKKNTWEFQLGVVGPLSLAEENQKFSHKILGSKNFEGWENQLHNEIAIEAIYETQWIYFSSANTKGFNFDLIPHWGFSAGNVSTYLNAGAEMRFGLNLPVNFGSCPIRAGCATNSAFSNVNHDAKGFRSWHFFAALDGRAVFRDIFLDGNTFTESHSVDKEFWVADLSMGIVFEYSNTLLVYSYIYRTKQFKTQTEEQIFGSISVSWTYH